MKTKNENAQRGPNAPAIAQARQLHRMRGLLHGITDLLDSIERGDAGDASWGICGNLGDTETKLAKILSQHVPGWDIDEQAALIEVLGNVDTEGQAYPPILYGIH